MNTALNLIPSTETPVRRDGLRRAQPQRDELQGNLADAFAGLLMHQFERHQASGLATLPKGVGKTAKTPAGVHTADAGKAAASRAGQHPNAGSRQHAAAQDALRPNLRQPVPAQPSLAATPEAPTALQASLDALEPLNAPLDAAPAKPARNPLPVLQPLAGRDEARLQAALRDGTDHPAPAGTGRGESLASKPVADSTAAGRTHEFTPKSAREPLASPVRPAESPQPARSADSPQRTAMAAPAFRVQAELPAAVVAQPDGQTPLQQTVVAAPLEPGLTPGAIESPALAARVGAPISHPNWATEFSQQVFSLATRSETGGSQLAHLQVSPPELGPLRITINLNDSVVHAVFTSAHAVVRQAVEQALPQLHQRLEQEGMSLGDAQVGEHDHPEHAWARREHKPEGRQGSGTPVATPARPDDTPAQPVQRGSGLINTFA